MHLTETIVSQTAQKVLGTMKISYEGQEIDLTPPWNRMTMIEAVAKYTGQDFSGIKDLDEARKMADAINVPYEKLSASVKSSMPALKNSRRETDPTYVYHRTSERNFTAGQKQ